MTNPVAYLEAWGGMNYRRKAGPSTTTLTSEEWRAYYMTRDQRDRYEEGRERLERVVARLKEKT